LSPYLNWNLRRCHELRPARSALPRERVRSLCWFLDAGNKEAPQAQLTGRLIQVLLGHAKLETTVLYTQVATNVIRAVMSPLDRLTPLTSKRSDPPE
jgi:integrase